MTKHSSKIRKHRGETSVLLLAAFFALGLQGIASAVTRNVPADYATVAAALTASSGGDIILLAQTHTANEYNLTMKSNVVIRGAGTGATIDMGRNGRLFAAISGVMDTLTQLDNLTIKRGKVAGVGAAIYMSSATARLYMKINDCVIRQCIATGASNGGAIYADWGAMFDVEGTSFIADTSAGSNGGAIALVRSQLLSKGNRFHRCVAGGGSGGALYVSNGLVFADRDTIWGCKAKDDGGALWSTSSFIEMTRGVIRADTSGVDGTGKGAIYSEWGGINARGLTIAGCKSAGAGNPAGLVLANMMGEVRAADIDSNSSTGSAANLGVSGGILEMYNSSCTNPLGTGSLNASLVGKYEECSFIGSPSTVGADVIDIQGQTRLERCIVSGGVDDGIVIVGRLWARGLLVKRAADKGIFGANVPMVIQGAVITNNGGDGCYTTYYSSHVSNAVVANNGGYGFNSTYNLESGFISRILTWNNTSGAYRFVDPWLPLGNANPQFAHAAQDSFKLNQATSPGINKGWNERSTMTSAVDYFGSGWNALDSLQVVFSTAAGDTTINDVNRVDLGLHTIHEKVSVGGGRVEAR